MDMGHRLTWPIIKDQWLEFLWSRKREARSNKEKFPTPTRLQHIDHNYKVPFQHWWDKVKVMMAMMIMCAPFEPYPWQMDQLHHFLLLSNMDEICLVQHYSELLQPHFKGAQIEPISESILACILFHSIITSQNSMNNLFRANQMRMHFHFVQTKYFHWTWLCVTWRVYLIL